MAEDVRVTSHRVGKGAKVQPPGPGWVFRSMCASSEPGVVWVAWRQEVKIKRSCPGCGAVAKQDPEKRSQCLGCNTIW